MSDFFNQSKYFIDSGSASKLANYLSELTEESNGIIAQLRADLARVTAERDALRAALEELEYRLDVYDNPEARELHRVAKSALSALP